MYFLLLYKVKFLCVFRPFCFLAEKRCKYTTIDNTIQDFIQKTFPFRPTFYWHETEKLSDLFSILLIFSRYFSCVKEKVFQNYIFARFIY